MNMHCIKDSLLILRDYSPDKRPCREFANPENLEMERLIEKDRRDSKIT